jgi:Mitochondrial import protein Pam17
MLRPVLRTCLRPRAATALTSPATAPAPAPAPTSAHTRLLSTSLLRPKFVLLYSHPSFYCHAGPCSPALASLPSARRHFTATTSTNAASLSWDEFLRLRRQRRLAGLIASFPTAILGLCGGGLYFATQELDPTQTILGMDPYIMSVVFTAGCGLFGWLMGPTVGRGVWHLVHRRQAQLVTEVSTLLCSFFPVQLRSKLTMLARGPIFQAYSEKQS